MELLYKELVYKIIGCAMEVYNTLGYNLLEAVYQEALEYELRKVNIKYVSYKQLKINYKDIILKKYYEADLLIENNIIVELKVMERLTKRDQSQIINYLGITNKKLGLLINFGNKEKLEWKRMILEKKSRE